VLKITAEIRLAKLVPRKLQLAAEIAHVFSMYSCGLQFAKNRVLHQPMKADGFLKRPFTSSIEKRHSAEWMSRGVRVRTVV
jgi:hypothetical protein